MSVNWVSIGSDNSLPSVRGQANTWTNFELLDTCFIEIKIKILIVLLRKYAWKIVGEMVAILSRAI